MESKPEVDEKVYTLDEVKQHKDEKSLWIAISDTVYDVTEFMEEVIAVYTWVGWGICIWQ